MFTFNSAVIITSATSCSNSFVYVASRSLHSLAVNGQAPRILSYTTKSGVPMNSLLFILGICCLSYMSTYLIHSSPLISINCANPFHPQPPSLSPSRQLRFRHRLWLVRQPGICCFPHQLQLDVPHLDSIQPRLEGTGDRESVTSIQGEVCSVCGLGRSDRLSCTH